MVSTANDRQNMNNIYDTTSGDTSASLVASAVKYAAPLATTPKRMRETTILLEEIGRGAGGTVYKAIHVPTMRLVAVKVSTTHKKLRSCHPVHQIVRMHTCVISYNYVVM
jgi:serine/threonine protein kinase